MRFAAELENKREIETFIAEVATLDLAGITRSLAELESLIKDTDSVILLATRRLQTFTNRTASSVALTSLQRAEMEQTQRVLKDNINYVEQKKKKIGILTEKKRELELKNAEQQNSQQHNRLSN